MPLPGVSTIVWQTICYKITPKVLRIREINLSRNVFKSLDDSLKHYTILLHEDMLWKMLLYYRGSLFWEASRWVLITCSNNIGHLDYLLPWRTKISELVFEDDRKQKTAKWSHWKELYELNPKNISANVKVNRGVIIPWIVWARYHEALIIKKSSWVLAHKAEYLFENLFWILNHLVVKLVPNYCN